MTLASYLVVALNLPLPAAPRFRLPGEAPYPCQDHGCGCASAEQCWSRCCCTTPEQRWAWAKANNVTPPAGTIPPDTTPPPGSWQSVRQRDREEKPTPSCCAKRQGAKPCASGCPAETSGDAEPGADAVSPAEVKTTPSRVPILNVLKCRGQSTLWVTSGAALPAAPRTTWQPGLHAIEVLPLHADFAQARPTVPVDPPPRRS